MRKINQQQITSVLALPAPKRYEHFIKTIVDWQEVWGLYNDGWALAADDRGQVVFPLWPAQEYASLCAVQDWLGYEPQSFTLDDLINEVIPDLRNDHMLPGIFYTPSNTGLIPSIDGFLSHIHIELEKY